MLARRSRRCKETLMETDRSLGADLEALVSGRPAPLVEAARIGQRVERPSRATWRFAFADGSLLKGRRLASEAAARDVEAIVARLDRERFPRVVARRGAALLEEWILGETAKGGAPLARWAGETLGAVHRTPPPDGLRPPPPPRNQLEEDVLWLVEAGALSPAEAQGLRARAAPPLSPPALVHRDLHPENVVLDALGRFHAVDNAAARLGHPDEDLARTFHRWPMAPAEEALFLEAYAAHRDPRGYLAHRRFWWAAAVARSARVRLERGYEGAAETVRRLREGAAGA
jgi:hypothetical protein